MPNDIKVVLPPDMKPEHTIRFGDAAKLHDPCSFTHKGIITAPADYDAVMKADNGIDKKDTVITANYTHRTITMTLFQTKPWKSTITGALAVHPELESFGINDRKKRYLVSELYDMLKFKARYFVKREQHAKLLAAIKEFDAKISVAIQDKDNLKGNMLQKRATEITSNLDLQFELRIPVFSHESKDSSKWGSFIVEINVGTDGNEVIFHFESESLYHYMRATTEQAFEDELQKFEGRYPIIRSY